MTWMCAQAFGLVVTVEAAFILQTGKIVRLSEQKFVDCYFMNKVY